MSLIRTLKVLIYTLSESNKIISKMAKEGSHQFFDAGKHWAKKLLQKASIEVNIIGENYDKNKSYIIVANHSSYLDIPVLLAYLDLKFVIMYKKELEKIPIFGKGLELSPFISVIRTNPRDAIKSLEKANQMLKENISVLVFPEGTRTSDGSLGEFKKGATRIAYKGKAEILPVRIDGTFDLMPKNQLSIKSGKITLKINKSISYSEYESKSEEELLLELKDVVSII